ncbi:flavodoxin [Eubacterium sp.]|uniref:flavodoxin n=1 Tax=Eubacterium sp. TaxID=142586 RepID=UPI0039A37B8B
MQKSTKGRLYKINPSKPYTKEDINYSVNKLRANAEQQSETSRPELKKGQKNKKIWGRKATQKPEIQKFQA